MTFTFLIVICVTISHSSRVHVHTNEIHSEQVLAPIQIGFNKPITNNKQEFSERSGEVLKGRSFNLGNLNTALSNLVDSTFIFKALLIYWIHLAFQTVGWYITSLVWNIGRGGEVDLDPDFSGAITDGLLDFDFASTNLALGAGQFVFYFLLWSAVITYGNLNSLGQNSAKSYQEESSWLDGYPAESRTDLDLSGSQIASALDDLFSPATITKQFVINILGATGGTLFLILVSLFPETFSIRKRRAATYGMDLSSEIEYFSEKWK